MVILPLVFSASPPKMVFRFAWLAFNCSSVAAWPLVAKSAPPRFCWSVHLPCRSYRQVQSSAAGFAQRNFVVQTEINFASRQGFGLNVAIGTGVSNGVAQVDFFRRPFISGNDQTFLQLFAHLIQGFLNRTDSGIFRAVRFSYGERGRSHFTVVGLTVVFNAAAIGLSCSTFTASVSAVPLAMLEALLPPLSRPF